MPAKIKASTVKVGMSSTKITAASAKCWTCRPKLGLVSRQCRVRSANLGALPANFEPFRPKIGFHKQRADLKNWIGFGQIRCAVHHFGTDRGVVKAKLCRLRQGNLERNQSGFLALCNVLCRMAGHVKMAEVASHGRGSGVKRPVR